MKSKWSIRDRSIQIVLLLFISGCTETPYLVGETQKSEDQCAKCPEGQSCNAGVCSLECDNDAVCGSCGYCHGGFCVEESSFCVLSVQPANGAVNIGLDLAAIVVQFSENIDIATVSPNVQLVDEKNNKQDIKTLTNGKQLSINLIGQLKAHNTYQLELKHGLASLQKNKLSNNYISTFTTGSAPGQQGAGSQGQKNNIADYHRYKLRAAAGLVRGNGITIEVISSEIGGMAENIDQSISVGRPVE